MNSRHAKNLVSLLLGVSLLVLAGVLTLSLGLGLVPKICVWIGLLVLLSLETRSSGWRRTLLYARLGLLCNVLSLFVLTLGKSLLISRGWYESPQAMGLFSQLQWALNTVPTLLQNLVVNHNWGVTIFPEYEMLYVLGADYANLLLQVVIVPLLLWLGTLLLKGVRREKSGKIQYEGER